MSNCSFDIAFVSSAAELVTKAQEAIVKAGGEVKGDEISGEFAIPSPLGRIAGGYVINGQTATFSITEKPIFLSCGLIESTMNNYLATKVA